MLSQQKQPLKNSKESWDAYSQNGWEINNGPEQTRLFASYFLKTVPLPRSAKTLLDVGCAMGDALPEFRELYPSLILHGCDFSEYFIQKAEQSYGKIARFYKWDIKEIQGNYDIIYCSNTLEHFADYKEIARLLLRHCHWLYILVPYFELRNGKYLQPVPGEWHVATFDKHSFDYLRSEKSAGRIRTFIRYTPGAWGTEPSSIINRIISLVVNKSILYEKKQIFYEICSKVLQK